MPATSTLLGVPAIAAAILSQLTRTIRNRSLVDAAPETMAIPIALLLPVATEMVVPGSSALGLATTGSGYDPALAWRLVLMPFHLFTSIGVLLPAGVAGAIMLARDSRGHNEHWIPGLTVAVACLGYIAAESLLPNNRLRLDAELKLSFLLAIGLVPAAAYVAADVTRQLPGTFAVVAAFLIALGLPSVVHDTIWHSCRGEGCTGDNTRATKIPNADWEALQWIRHSTDTRAVFQQSPQPDFLAGGYDVWIPVFAGRAIYASRRASNAPWDSIREMRRLFEPSDTMLPSERASLHGIDYLYLSRHLEREKFDSLYSRYAADPGLELVHHNEGVGIWHVRKNARRKLNP
jgi:hypothetical protein